MISSVAFHHITGSTSPNVVLQGSSFGTRPSPSYQTGGCPNHGTGRVYGTAFYFNDTTRGWQAGHGGPNLNTNCIGIIITSWTNKSVTFKFGSAFGSGAYVLNSGNRYSVVLRGVKKTGTVKFT